MRAKLSRLLLVLLVSLHLQGSVLPWGKYLLRERQAVKVHVSLPNPSISYKSIREAISLYSIDVRGTDISFNPTLSDRAIIDLGTTPYKVEVGPLAFRSWGVLGSTLAHETEIHARQSIIWGLFANYISAVVNWIRGISLPEHLSLVGDTILEREAYLFEIHSGERFGLSQDEISATQDLVDYFYPVECTSFWF